MHNDAGSTLVANMPHSAQSSIHSSLAADQTPPASPLHKRRISSFGLRLDSWLRSPRSRSNSTSPRNSQSPSTPRTKRGSWTLSRPVISHPRQISLDLHSAALASPPASPNMDRSSTLEVVPAGKFKQQKEAREMALRVQERAKKLNIAAPPYDLVELIGKGAFGRVYKSRRKDDKSVVAVKIIDIDSSDYNLIPSEKDQAIKDLVQEIAILRTLKDSKAKNINVIHEAFNFHSQFWIVSEYCPGGSVHTLMRAHNAGLDEKYVVTIARELAVAVKYVHDAGIIHRDIKSANILITQEGQVQLCDFGVSGILESDAAKRSTIIGTPYWMAPELLGPKKSVDYGFEIDCWAFGCTVYEMACGKPPNSHVPPSKLHLHLVKAPRLDEKHSQPLRDFVAFCIEFKEQRPTAEKIIKHPYLVASSKKYPTAILRQLIEHYAKWEKSGGQRASLWQPNGAAGATNLGDLAGEDEWNFSTTDDFADEVLSHFGEPTQQDPSYVTFDKLQQDHRAKRGKEKMNRLFDESAEPYQYEYEDFSNDEDSSSDLPFRRSTAFANKRETLIDLDEARASQDLSSLELADAETIRAKKSNRFFYTDDDDEDDYQYHSNDTQRFDHGWTFANQGQMTAPVKRATREWTMAGAMQEASHPTRPPLKHTVTEPIGNVGDFLHSNLSLEPPEEVDGDSYSRSDFNDSTIRADRSSLHAHSFSASTDNSFEMVGAQLTQANLHERARSVAESVNSLRNASLADDEEGLAVLDLRHPWTSSLVDGDEPVSLASDNESSILRRPQTMRVSQRLRRYESDADSEVNVPIQTRVPFPQPPDAASLEDDADPEHVINELGRLLDGFLTGLDTTRSLILQEKHRQEFHAYQRNLPTMPGNSSVSFG